MLAAAPWLVEGWATGWRFRLWVGFCREFRLLNVLDHCYREILSRDRGCGGLDAASLKKYGSLVFYLCGLSRRTATLRAVVARAREMALSTRFYRCRTEGRVLPPAGAVSL